MARKLAGKFKPPNELLLVILLVLSIHVSTMSFLFSSSVPSYADEQTAACFSYLALQPGPSKVTAAVGRSGVLKAVAAEISATRPVSRSRLVELLEQVKENAASLDSQDEVTDEVMARMTALVWREVMRTIVDGAVRVDAERSWWEQVIHSRRGVGVYLVQSEQ